MFNSLRNFVNNVIVPWLPLLYVLVLAIALPVVAFTFLPPHILRFVYLTEVGIFGFVCLWVTIETFTAGLSRLRKAPVASLKEWPEVAYIVPAYLNNEAVVLDDTIKAYLALEYPGSVSVWVVYNCKGDLSEIEAGLKEKYDGKQSGRVQIHIRKNFHSTSKAENVNFGLSLMPKSVGYIGIMDADHQPAPNNTLAAISAIVNEKLDIVQGACTIRNADNLLSRIVAIEFEDIYNVGHQGRTNLLRLGVFGGSNGMWSAPALQHIQMDGNMLTEDIDSSIRATLAGYRIGYSSHMISSELSPLTWTTLHKQRLRWAQGWLQVSVKHFLATILSRNTSFRQKIACIFLLGWREAFTYFVLHPPFLVAVAAFRGELSVTLMYLVMGGVILALGASRTLMTYQLARGPYRRSIPSFALFLAAQLTWCLYMNFIQIMSHAREMLHMHQWTATVRELVARSDSQETLVAPVMEVVVQQPPTPEALQVVHSDEEHDIPAAAMPSLPTLATITIASHAKKGLEATVTPRVAFALKPVRQNSVEISLSALAEAVHEALSPIAPKLEAAPSAPGEIAACRDVPVAPEVSVVA